MLTESEVAMDKCKVVALSHRWQMAATVLLTWRCR